MATGTAWAATCSSRRCRGDAGAALARRAGSRASTTAAAATRTRFVCGFLACDSRLCRPLLGALPRMLRVPLGDGPAAAWITGTLQHGAAETRAPRAGAEAVLAKLSELLFVEAIRRYIETLPEDQRGWLAGLRDPHVEPGARPAARASRRAPGRWRISGARRACRAPRSPSASRR